MFGNKGKKKSESTKRKISEALKRKGKQIKKGASKAAVKGAEGLGYGIGRFADKLDAAGNKIASSKKVQRAIDAVDENPTTRRVTGKVIDVVTKGIDRGYNQLERGTRAKSVVALTKGFVKGAYDTAKGKEQKAKR